MLNEISPFYNQLVLIESLRTNSFGIGWLSWVNPRDSIGERYIYINTGKKMKGDYITAYDYRLSYTVYNIKSISLLEMIPFEESNPNLEDHPHLVVLRNQVINCSVTGFASLIENKKELKFWHKSYWYSYSDHYEIASLKDHIPLFYGIKERYIFTDDDRSKSSDILRARGYTDEQIWATIDTVYY